MLRSYCNKKNPRFQYNMLLIHLKENPVCFSFFRQKNMFAVTVNIEEHSYTTFINEENKAHLPQYLCKL